jgi:hypothetical protein
MRYINKFSHEDSNNNIQIYYLHYYWCMVA